MISMVADLQDPPELIREFVAQWEEGYKVVIGVKKESLETRTMFFVRGLYYRLVGRLSEVPLVRNFTGFGLYDRVVIDTAARDRRPVPVLPRPDLRSRATSAPRCRTCSRRASAASPRTTSTPSTTWRCWASPTTPRCRCAWRRWPGSPCRSSACWSPSATSSPS